MSIKTALRHSRESGDDHLDITHKIRTTDYLETRFNLSDPNDPIARQYMPSAEETVPSLLDQTDPIGDHKNGVGKLIVHRYPDRLLLLATDHCAAYCRFCFRKDRVGKGEAVPHDADMEEALSYIEKNKSIWEVIFSGGDPLILSPRRLEQIISRVVNIPHVKTIRFHTRMPVSDPSRITPELAKAIVSNKATYIVIHANHPDELTQEAINGFRILQKSGAVLLSQSVLLRGVNDNAETLEQLFRGLVENSIKPYYLHHPDLVEGSAHFQLSLDEGEALMKDLRGKISGLCWPTYVLDIPGGFGKVPVNASYLTKTPDGRYLVEDIYGDKHAYPPKAKHD
ncbi:MAG: lysine 2,3-aminomutase [Micavibrio aeruginosavorus]|uniref:Lysine 2,3-aminomutase n=1 Tax=Micavibrio aeruginosavorus TaxID=349221 RepID=A0A2W5HL50_9BACT|nr:MAG: lysine 2,3-aminomutase [Micavibrio aeruginosavorus]